MILFKSQKEASAYQSIDGLIFGTVYHITYQSTEELKPSIDKTLKQFNNSLSPFDSTSVISKVNRNEEIELDDYFTDYLESRPTTRQLLREYAEAIVSNPYCSVDLEVAIDLLSKYYTEEERRCFWHYFRCLKAKAKAKAV